MQALFERTNRFMLLPLNIRPRAVLVASALLLGVIYVFPLWRLTMFAPQYPQGLRMAIYSYKLDGGNRGQDVREINVLNHYIGMRELTTEEFGEFKWMPFVVGALGLLFLRAAVHGTMGDLVDVVMLYTYFSLFSLWSFAYKLYSYGHNLSPKAPVKVAPFMPPMFGYEKIANFEIYSYPALGSYVLGAVAVLLLAAFAVTWRDNRHRFIRQPA